MKFGDLVKIVELALLNEITSSKKNKQLFKDKYKVDLPDVEIENIFNRFNNQQSRLTNTNIFNYNSLQELLNALEQKSGKEIEQDIRDKETNIIIDNDKMTVVEPLTINSSRKYGANTKWCTTTTDESNGFDYWFKDYSLVYLIDKINNKKYAIAFNPYLDEQAWDETDEGMGLDEILEIFNLDFNDVFDKVIPKDYPEEI